VTLRDRRVILGGAGVAATLLVVVMTARDTETPVAGRPAARRGSSAARAAAEVPLNDVKLELLRRTPSALEEPERNPFRFQARPAAPADKRPQPQSAPAPQAAVPTAAPPVVTPSGPPPPPPIPLRFIGLVNAPGQAGSVAILSDGRGNILYGKEGDAVEGRYRMLRVSPEMVEMSYVDGRGRQTIRLSGQ
jgi:hypothetical protein